MKKYWMLLLPALLLGTPILSNAANSNDKTKAKVTKTSKNKNSEAIIMTTAEDAKFERPEDGKVVLMAIESTAPENNNEDNAIYTRVTKKAEFPGGQDSLLTYLSKHVYYPKEAAENGAQGTVLVKFTVNKDGSLQDFGVVKSSGEDSLDKEALRVCKTMPNFVPGEVNGKIVRSTYLVPVGFKLPEWEL